MNIELLREGTPEQQAALLELAAAARRSEKRRAAVVRVVQDDYDKALAKGGQEAIDRAADFVRELRGADQNHSGDMHKAIEATFKVVSGGHTMAELTQRITDAMGGLGIVGFAIDSDGHTVPMTHEGPVDGEIPAEVLEVIADLAQVPGVVPPEIQEALGDVLGAMIADRKSESQPADGDLSFLNGIDLDAEARPVRDFDGGVG